MKGKVACLLGKLSMGSMSCEFLNKSFWWDFDTFLQFNIFLVLVKKIQTNGVIHRGLQSWKYDNARIDWKTQFFARLGSHPLRKIIVWIYPPPRIQSWQMKVSVEMPYKKCHNPSGDWYWVGVDLHYGNWSHPLKQYFSSCIISPRRKNEKRCETT